VACAAALLIGGLLVTLHAEVIDRLMATVDSQPILLSDVNAAIVFRLAQPATEPDRLAAVLDKLIERTLMLEEVERYQPPEPAPAELDNRVADIERLIGPPAAFENAVAATGMTRDRLRQWIRDDLRIATYLNQRFGGPSEPSDADVLAYYRAHPAEFTTGGTVQPFEAVAPQIRARLGQSRRSTSIADWLSSLRRRADVAVLYTANR
jgi:hypothetical protein